MRNKKIIEMEWKLNLGNKEGNVNSTIDTEIISNYKDKDKINLKYCKKKWKENLKIINKNKDM